MNAVTQPRCHCGRFRKRADLRWVFPFIEPTGSFALRTASNVWVFACRPDCFPPTVKPGSLWKQP